MCKKLYKTAQASVFFTLLIIMQLCFSDTTTPPSSGAIGQNGQVAISASQKQLTQIKTLFDQADYQHLANPTNVVNVLVLDDEQ